MPFTNPMDRVRRQIADREAVPAIVLALFRVDKGSAFARMEDIRDEAMAVYVEAALALVTPEAVKARQIAVHSAVAHKHADWEQDRETAMRQARQDIANHVEPVAAHFGSVPFGHCAKCRLPVGGHIATLLLTDSLKVDVHLACIEPEIADGKITQVGPFTFRLVEIGGRL